MFINKAHFSPSRSRGTLVGIALLVICCVFILTAFTQQPPTTIFDLVLCGGHVMDPESGLDAVRNVGITDGRIAKY